MGKPVLGEHDTEFHTVGFPAAKAASLIPSEKTPARLLLGFPAAKAAQKKE